MAEPIVIYGDAVQAARNRLRSAQISTMVEILRNALFAGTDETAASFAKELQTEISALPAAPPGKPRAQAALTNAKDRIASFVAGRSIRDIFAVGDALRYVGEYIEFGGAPDGSVGQFESELRNKTAFGLANRAREAVPGYLKEEKPDLGLFKFRLTDRSVVRYMERFYGPYIGADISGTTTDSLAALVYLHWGQENLPDRQRSAKEEIRRGHELVPIAAMVLQYHHSLLECGLALALTSNAMSTPGLAAQAAISAYQIYDYSTLANTPVRNLEATLRNGNQTLASDLGGRGLVVLRDFIDIQGADDLGYEIGLLIDNPQQNPIFKLDDQKYRTFLDSRYDTRLSDNYSYIKGESSLVSLAVKFANDLGIQADDLAADPARWLRELASSSKTDLEGSNHYSNLDDALTAARKAGGLAAASPGLQTPDPAATPTLAATATPSPPPSSAGITTNQLQDLKKALAIVQLLEGSGTRG